LKIEKQNFIKINATHKITGLEKTTLKIPVTERFWVKIYKLPFNLKKKKLLLQIKVKKVSLKLKLNHTEKIKAGTVAGL
jgi:hypothetical protein